MQFTIKTKQIQHYTNTKHEYKQTKTEQSKQKNYQGIHSKTWRKGWKDLLQGLTQRQSGKAQRERGKLIQTKLIGKLVTGGVQN